jgi:hypothetical protein
VTKKKGSSAHGHSAIARTDKGLLRILSDPDFIRASTRRHATLPMVDSAVELCRYTYGKCEELLQRDEDEDARPEDASSWRAWFEHKKNGVSRYVPVKILRKASNYPLFF